MKPTDFALQMPTSPADIENHRHPSQTTIAAVQSQPLTRNLYDRSLSSAQAYQQELQRQQHRQFRAHPFSKGLQTDVQTLYMQRLRRDARQELRQMQEQFSEQGQQQHQHHHHRQQQQPPQHQQRQQQQQQQHRQQQQQPQQQPQQQQHQQSREQQEEAELDHCGYNQKKSHLPHEHHPPPVATDFCAPNLYRISLQLTAELEIGRWWDNVIDIFTSSYGATRLLLSVPHDLTDTVNTPWGAKAIYNKDSCHSANVSCQDSIPDSCSLTSSSSDNSHLLFDALQPFDCDMDPLVDNKGILKILQRGKVVVVSREYHHPGENRSTSQRSWNSTPNTPQQVDDAVTQLRTASKQAGTPGADPPWSKSLDTPCLNDMEEGHCSYFTHREGMHCHLSNHHHHHHGEATRLCDYEDFEQQQPSPWSQSPAPSPAVIDLNVNPFFQSMPEIDEDAFEPATATPPTYASANFSYTAMTDKNIYSIVHIPLIHPTTARNVAPTNAQHSPVPIAILSFLSCIVPYPAHLLQSLHSLAPFLATTLSVASIHEQTVKQSLIHTASLRNTRQKRRRTSGMTAASAPETVLGDEGEEIDGASSDEYSAASSTSSRWEYATVFSASMRLDGTAGSDREDRITLQQSPDPPRSICDDDDDYDEDRDDDGDDDDDDDEYQSSDNDLTADFSPSMPRPGKQRRASTPRTRSHHRPRRKSIRRSRRTSSLMARPPVASNGDKGPRVLTPSTKMLRLILDVMPNAVYTCSRSTGECTWVNKRYLQYTGLRIEDLLESKWIDSIHKDDQQRVMTSWKTAFERGEGFSGQYRIRRFDGKYRWFLGRAGPLRDARGGVIYWFGTCTDVHDQKIAEEQQSRQLRIEANEKKYRLLAEAIPQIVFTATPNDGITYVNAKWTKYSSQTPEQACGLGFLSHVHPDDRHCCVLPEVTATAGEVTPHPTEVRLMQVDGTYRWFLVKCISVEDSEQGRKWFGTCTDINKHKLLEQKLKEAHDAAQRSTESKTRFLSNMSHEIRTPLIGITGMINFMLDTNLTEEQLDFAHTIQQSADALLLVINDILDLSKVEAGMMKLAMEPFSCHTMIEDANELLSTLAIQKGLELSFIVEDDVPDVICGDRIRLRQVLLNVIGNAIKFTSVGEIFSRCSMQSMDLEKREVILLFEVVDTGDGFSPTEEALIFRPFSQANSSPARKHGGSGLGLVISRQLIELHGGTMSCKSKKGDGSTFYFTAKFTVPPESTMPRPQTPTTEVSDSPFFRYSKAAVESSRRPEAQTKTMSLPSPPPPPSSSSSSSSSSISSSSSTASSISLRDSRCSSTSDTGFAKISPASSPETLGGAPPTNLETPPVSLSRPATPTTGSRPTTPSFKARKPVRIELPRPPRILLVAELVNARETLIHYVRSILPREPVSDIDVCESFLDANSRLLQPGVKPYTHVLVNLQQQTQVIALASTIKNVSKLADTICVILTTPIQRFGIVEGAQGNLPIHTDYIIKPLNRCKMEGLFDASTTVRENFLRRRNTRQIVASQQEVFKRMAADVGNKGHRVLLVEDNFVNQKVMAQYLHRVGIEVTVASNGKQCLEEFYARPHDYFDVILCDLFMPMKDGYETTKEIRAWEADNLHPEIPIIALSANVMADVVERCREAGFTDYVSKPVDFATLSDVLRTVLNDDD